MRLSYLPSEFQKALPILEKIKAAGFEAYFVGGSVRDALLNRPIHDVDIASSSYPEETKQIFERTVDIGIEHGTVLVLENGGEYEVTTFRTEDVYVDYRRPSSVSFVRSLEEVPQASLILQSMLLLLMKMLRLSTSSMGLLIWTTVF